MESVTFGLVLAAVVIAFAAGSRWRHNKRTWADWRLARTGERNYRRLRWGTLRVAAVFVIFLTAFLIGIARMTLSG